VQLLSLSAILGTPQGDLLENQKDLLKFYLGCSTKQKEEKWNEENEKLGKLFKIMYHNFGERFKKTSTQTLGKLNSRENMEELLSQFSEEEYQKFCQLLEIPIPKDEILDSVVGQKVAKTEIYNEIVKAHYEDKNHSYSEIANESLYPTEEMLWDTDEIPYKCDQSTNLAIPYLGSSYQTLEDYLSRIFWLYRLDSAFYIRDDIERSLAELRNSKKLGNQACIPIKRFAFMYIKSPMVGMSHPAEVRAEVEISLSGI
jgi:intron-binding protein aquarius